MSEDKKNTPLVLSILGINGINGIDDDTNNTNNTNNTSYHDIQIYLTNLGEKEQIAFLLSQKTNLASQQIRDELKNPSMNVPRVIGNNKEYFIVTGTEGKKALYGLTAEGLEFIKRIITNYIKSKQTSKEKESFRPRSEELIIGFKNLIPDLKDKMKIEEGVYHIDFQLISESNPSLSDAILENPEDNLRIFELAFEESLGLKNIRVRLYNLPKTQHTTIEKLRSEYLDCLISLDVNVRQLSDVRPQVINAKFECPSCGTIISVLQIEKKFREPSRCSCGRRGGFKLISKEMVDTARMIIEDPPGINSRGSARINAFIKEDLVKFENYQKVLPGKKIKINGILKEVPIALSTGGLSTRFELALEVLSIESSEIDVSGTINAEDILEIEEFSIKLSEENGMKHITDLVAPEIISEEEVKQALICSALSCDNEFSPSGTLEKNKIHVLLCGDIALAKTQTSQAVVNITPGATYQDATKSSSVGLTAAVVKDEFTKGWTLEAGTLVLHNNGFVVLDEFDKIDPLEQQTLHEPLESQTVTISKANVHASLPAHTAVALLANPKKGIFEEGKTLEEQINIVLSIINRCDLTIILRDSKNQEKDCAVAQAILDRGRNSKKELSPLDNQFIRKYFYYVKQQPTPTLPKELDNLIKDEFTNLRSSLELKQRKFITYRYVNALKSLSKAYARLRLSEKVEELDVRRAINLIKFSYNSLGIFKRDIETPKIGGTIQ